MRILLFGGFLGSGKTSTILQVAKQITETRNQTVAIIENEIGVAGIDDQLLSGSGFQVKPLFGGCVCCQLAGDLMAAIREMAEKLAPDWVIIEMTGIGVPGNIAAMLRQGDATGIACRTITVVDAERWHILKRAVGPLIHSQLVDSDVVIVNKTDIAGVDVKGVIDEVKMIAGGAPVITSCAKQELPIGVVEEVFRFA